MAAATPEVITVLRATAERLRGGAKYQWGHAGVCNCGHLAQVVTGYDGREIYRQVAGEWSEHLNDYCLATGDSVADAATRLMRFGFAPTDLRDLEYLRNKKVLGQMPWHQRHLRRNERDDVVRYLEAWADLLQGQLDSRTQDASGADEPEPEPPEAALTDALTHVA